MTEREIVYQFDLSEYADNVTLMDSDSNKIGIRSSKFVFTPRDIEKLRGNKPQEARMQITERNLLDFIEDALDKMEG